MNLHDARIEARHREASSPPPIGSFILDGTTRSMEYEPQEIGPSLIKALNRGYRALGLNRALMGFRGLNRALIRRIDNKP